MMDLSKGVWSRTGRGGNLSERGYLAAIMLATIYGLILTAACAYWGAPYMSTTTMVPVKVAASTDTSSVPVSSVDDVAFDDVAPDVVPDDSNVPETAPQMKKQVTISWLPFLLFGILIPFAGIGIALTSDIPIFSFLGFNMVAGGLGLILGPAMLMYNASIILSVILVTGGVVTVTSAIGIIYPRSLAHWGSYLGAGLLGLIFVLFGQLFLQIVGVDNFLVGRTMDLIISWFASFLFSAYIIYDWNYALRLERTLDNAIDVALALYLDIINLFIHLMTILGGDNN